MTPADMREAFQAAEDESFVVLEGSFCRVVVVSDEEQVLDGENDVPDVSELWNRSTTSWTENADGACVYVRLDFVQLALAAAFKAGQRAGQ